MKSSIVIITVALTTVQALGLPNLGNLLGTVDTGLITQGLSMITDFVHPTVNWTAYPLDQWWGPGDSSSQDVSIRPAEIKFDETMIEDLKARLKNHKKFAAPLKDSGFTYGFNTDAIEPWLEYWANEYDFNAREAFFNQFPQYKTNIQGLDIHYIHIKPEEVPEGKEVVPLLALHGWPGSIREFYETIPLMTAVSDDRDFVVELIVPCLPGFGFSDPAIYKGMGGAQVAIILRNLMQRLNHTQFYIQGGDWGGLIGSLMCTLFPEEVLGFHTNFGIAATPGAMVLTLIGDFLPSFVVGRDTAERMYPLSKVMPQKLGELGYFYIQATKPDSLGVGLTDSPSGLLAYVLQIVAGGTNYEYNSLDDGGLTKKYTKDQLLDCLMMYWVPGAATTSMRIYAEGFSKDNVLLGTIPTSVPTVVVQAKNEFIYQSEKILKTKYKNLLSTEVIDFGGHFLALEEPEYFAESVLNVLGDFRKFHESDNSTSQNVFQKIGSGVKTVGKGIGSGVKAVETGIGSGIKNVGDKIKSIF